jgi:membrane protease YdiL (CAAX protease family)
MLAIQLSRLEHNRQPAVSIRVKAIIRNLSAPAEFCLIIFICFGLTIAVCSVWIFHHTWRAPQAHADGVAHPGNKDVIHLKNDGIVASVVIQLTALGIALWIGRIRGWSLATFGLRASWKWVGLGILLFLAFQLVIHLVHLLMTGSWQAATAPHGKPAFLRVSHLTIPFVILVATINPVFEEAIESGYFFHALQRYGAWVTVFAAALFRGFLHTTMGLNGFITMLAMGLLYGFVYWRWRQMWPLIIAHSLQMLYALLPQALAA